MVIKSTIKPAKNSTSANFSNLTDCAVSFRIARKENKQLLIKITMAKAAPSSIKEDSLRFDIFTDVNTMKQKPNKLAEVFNMCGDLFSFICWQN